MHGTAFRIESYVGAGPLKFGLPSREIRSILLAPFELVPDKAVDPAFPSEFYTGLLLFIHYRAPGVCVAVEFNHHGSPVPTFTGQTLLGRSYHLVEAWFKVLDPKITLEDVGLTSFRFGVGLYAPSARKEPELPVEGVIAFDHGYYSSANG